MSRPPGRAAHRPSPRETHPELPGSGEFDLIARHLRALGAARPDVLLGVGDDAALVAEPPADLRAAMLSVRPRPGEAPDALARRLVQGTLERLRETGASPAWATLALTLAEPDEARIAALGAALGAAAGAAGITIVGGDTTHGPTRLTLTVLGPVAPAPAPGPDGPA